MNELSWSQNTLIHCLYMTFTRSANKVKSDINIVYMTSMIHTVLCIVANTNDSNNGWWFTNSILLFTFYTATPNEGQHVSRFFKCPVLLSRHHTIQIQYSGDFIQSMYLVVVLSLWLYHRMTCDSVYNTEVVKVTTPLPCTADLYFLLQA